MVAPYLQSLQQELELIASLLPQRRRLAQVHWGGGTPNYLNAEEQSQLWNLVTRHFDLEPELEASIEVNPEFIDQGQALHLRALGFNRISFGTPNTRNALQNRPARQLRTRAAARSAGKCFSSQQSRGESRPVRSIGTLDTRNARWN